MLRTCRRLTLFLLLFGSSVCAETIEVGLARIKVTIPKGFQLAFAAPGRSVLVLTRPAANPGARPDQLILWTEALPAAGASLPVWVTGHEFTWGMEIQNDTYAPLTWRMPDSRTRVTEGLRTIDGTWENRLAALLPKNGVGVAIALRGNDGTAAGQLREDLHEIAVSLGATVLPATPMRGFCGGCGGSRGTGLSDLQQTLLLGGVLLGTIVFACWLGLKVAETAIARCGSRSSRRQAGPSLRRPCGSSQFTSAQPVPASRVSSGSPRLPDSLR